MWIVYCRSHKRRPVRFGRGAPFTDSQACIPTGWCETCGRELFGQRSLCDWCRSKKGEF